MRGREGVQDWRDFNIQCFPYPSNLLRIYLPLLVLPPDIFSLNGFGIVISVI